MCKKQPGLRCAHHARLKLNEENSSLQELVDQAAVYKRVPAKLSDAINSQLTRVSLTERDYFASTQGLKELKKAYEAAQKAGDENKAGDISLLIERAQNDREDHQLAEKVINRYGDHLSDIGQIPSVSEARSKEEKANGFYARVLNDPSSTMKDEKYAEHLSNSCKKRRIQAEHVALRDITGLHQAEITSVGTCKDALSENKEAYMYLTSADFGKTRAYLPNGTYCQVTTITDDDSGNYILTVEGVRDIRVGRSRKLLLKS